MLTTLLRRRVHMSGRRHAKHQRRLRPPLIGNPANRQHPVIGARPLAPSGRRAQTASSIGLSGRASCLRSLRQRRSHFIDGYRRASSYGGADRRRPHPWRAGQNAESAKDNIIANGNRASARSYRAGSRASAHMMKPQPTSGRVATQRLPP